MPPWDRYAQQQPTQQAPQPTPAPSYPGVIRGPAPTPDPITPVQESNMQNDAARLQMEQERLRMAQESAERDATNAERGSVEQGRAAGFLRRAINGNTNFGQIDIAPRSLPGQIASEILPNVSNIMSDADRQRAEQAEREFIAGILRYDSGAAIPPDEFVSMGRTYFPRPGDTPETIAQKAEARRVAIQGLAESAGAPGLRIWEEYSANIDGGMAGAAGGGSGPVPTGTNPNGGGPQPTLRDMYPQGGDIALNEQEGSFDRAEYLANEYGVQPNQERQLVGMLNMAARGGNRANFSAADVQAIYGRLGIPLPDEAGIQQLVDGVRSGTTYSGFDTQAAEAEYQQMLDSALQGTGDNPEGIMPTVGVGLSQGLTLGLADEARGVAGAIGAAAQGENPFTAYQVNRDLDRRFAERSREANPGTALTSEIVGNLFTGGFRAAPALMRTERPIAAAAREGAIFGGVTGFGQGEGTQNSLLGGVTGAGIGGAAGTGLAIVSPYATRVVGRVREAIAPRQPLPAAGAVDEVMQAGERMAVPVRRADVDPNVRDTRANVLQTEAGQPVRQMERDDLDAMETALTRELGGDGTRDPFASGEAIQSGVRGIIDRARTRASGLYQRAGERSANVRIQPARALEAIDQQIAELTEIGANANRETIRFLNEVKADLTRDGGLTVAALRGQRTNLRGNLANRGLSMTDAERRVSTVLDAAADDLAENLPSDARGLFQRADSIWRQQAEFQQHVGRQLLGTSNQPVSPEQAAQRIASFVGRDFKRANRIMSALDPETREAIAAQIAANLGRRANGDFSLAQFLTHTGGGKGRLIDERTTRLIFGERGVKAIRDLRTLAGAKVAATERTNTSNTGGMVNRAANGLRTMIFGAMGVAEGGVAGGAVTIAAGKMLQRMGEARAVRLLTNPDFTNWLRRLPETDSPRTIDGAFSRLRRVAAGNAQFQSDVQAFQQALAGAANDNAVVAGNVAASPEQQD